MTSPFQTPEVVAFGLPALWVAVAIFVGTYLLVMTERINRAILALLGAGLMILTGVLTQEAALNGVDFNTIGLLLGMMVIVAITKKSGIFQYVAIQSARAVRGHPVGLIVMLSTVTALFSSLLDNVTTVLLITPVILRITRDMGIKPYPFLFAAIFASNIGGTATLIGDPPNIMIGSAANLSFNDFLVHLAPICVVVFAATLAPICWIWRRDLQAMPRYQQTVMALNAKAAITDARLLKQALVVLGGVLGGFVLGHPLGLMPATVAMFGAAVLLLLDNLGHAAEHQAERVHAALSEAEWITLFFFIGLFILVTGIEHVGVIHWLADHLLAATGGSLAVTALAVLWGSALLSALIDNIPFVATMIPLLQAMGPAFGGDAAIQPLWWSLALGACLGGNGSLIGASANLVVAGMAERDGHPIRFVPFLLMAFPLMLIGILISTVYIALRYL